MMAQHKTSPASSESSMSSGLIAILLGMAGVLAFLVWLSVYVAVNTPGEPWKMLH
jgi:hypothetical protein